jgi:two-component system LytT family response regulator
MKRLRVLVVDDERLAREKLRRLLAEEPDVELIGECASGADAVRAIRREAPDLVLLDIQMPGVNGLDVLREVGPAEIGRVVFVTAYDEFAVQAFEVEALDYLLKPFDATRLRQALSRARRQAPDHLPERMASLLETIVARERHVRRFLVRCSGRMSFVRVEEVDWIEAADNYVRLHAGRDEHLLRETMAALEARLDPRRFARVHRSAIVNVEAVTELRPLFHGDYELLLKTGASVPVGRSYRDSLFVALAR